MTPALVCDAPRVGRGVAGVLLGLAASPAIAADAPELTIYGHLNFGVISVDNGAGGEAYFAENPHSPSRVGLTYNTPLAQGGALTFQFETGFGLTGLDDVSPAEPSFKADIDRKVLRKFEVIWDTPNAGRLSFGQGNMASEGASGADLSGTILAQGPAIGDLGGATEFLLQSGAPSGITVADAFDDLAGLRRFRLRYDTPDWQGFTLSAAYGQEILRSNNSNDYYDVALRYAREAGHLRYESVLSYEWVDDVAERLVSSASVLHVPTGLNASVALGSVQDGMGDYAYLKLGVIRDAFRAGSTAISVEYYHGDDFAFAGSQSRVMGIGVVQTLDAANVDVFATLRQYELSGGPALRDVNIAAFGARWRF